MKQYAFILGRVYTLSIAELDAVFRSLDLSYQIIGLSPEAAVVECERELDARKVQARLGGIIKICKILKAFPYNSKDLRSLFENFERYLTYERVLKDFFAQKEHKIEFGVSPYFLTKTDIKYELPWIKRFVTFGFNLKKIFQKHGLSLRFVTPETPFERLSSVMVTKNRLLEKGAEIVFIIGTKHILVGKTLTVQDFEDYGRRDYQRPVRDMRTGMLPPKVAQIMLNLTALNPSAHQKANTYILDPFCGLGTILQEGMLLGFRMAGSDIDQKILDGAEKNLQWFRVRYKLPPGRYQIFQADATKLAKHIPPKWGITGIVTESDLGPLYEELPTAQEMKENFAKLTKTYVAAFKEFGKFLKSGQRVIISFPAYKLGTQGYAHMPQESVDKICKSGYSIATTVPEYVTEKYKFLQITKRQSIVYDRKDQIVAREIIVFERT